MKHLCHAIGCEVECPPRRLFCLPHWQKTPKVLQTAVWQCYARGQERTKRPSARYLVVQAMAVAAVARIEGRFSDEQMHAHLRQCRDLLGKLDDDDQQYVLTVARHLREATRAARTA